MRNRNLLHAVLVVALLSAATCVRADFEEGNRAYQRGEYQRAFQEYREAAEKGHVAAQGKLAALYLYGRGTPTDYQKAYLWFEMAARQGDKHAGRFRDAAAGAMTRAQYEEAEAMVDSYYERYVAPFDPAAE